MWKLPSGEVAETDGSGGGSGRVKLVYEEVANTSDARAIFSHYAYGGTYDLAVGACVGVHSAHIRWRLSIHSLHFTSRISLFMFMCGFCMFCVCSYDVFIYIRCPVKLQVEGGAFNRDDVSVPASATAVTDAELAKRKR